jgi:hypothetical protein
VAIIDNTAPAWAGGGRWRLSDEPLLTIGVRDGADEYVFFGVGSAVRLEDGRIVVSNGGTQEIRFYDPDGSFLKAVGGVGNGPGEYRALGPIWRMGPDSLLVFDNRNFRFSILDLDGTPGRTFRLEEGRGRLLFPEGVFPDGTLLVSGTVVDLPGQREPGAFRDLRRLTRYSTEPALIDSLGELPGDELFRAVGGDGLRTMSRPYGLEMQTASGPSGWFYGSGESHEILEWAKEGGQVRIIRWVAQRRPLQPEVTVRWEEELRQMPNRFAAEVWASIPLPTVLPAYDGLMVDAAGNLWVGEYLVLDETPRFTVFHPSGRWLGEVEIPGDGRVTEIGRDYVLGIWTDDLDVQEVRLYGLIKDPVH